MKRGDLVVVAARGMYTGRPRSALVVQSDLFNEVHASITICPVTSEIVDAGLFRIPLPPGSRTGLDTPSQVMVDKIVSVPRATISRVIGQAADNEMAAVSDALVRWLDL
jgi:mRNA interferase MazF